MYVIVEKFNAIDMNTSNLEGIVLLFDCTLVLIRNTSNSSKRQGQMLSLKFAE